MIARIETSRRLQDNWIEQVEDHKIIREEVPRYKYARYKAGFSALATECLCRDCRENFHMRIQSIGTARNLYTGLILELKNHFRADSDKKRWHQMQWTVS